MNNRKALTLQTQLSLPLFPLVVDTLARGLMLHNKLHWYQIPDLVTLLITHALFCLGIMAAVNAPALPSDADLSNNYELVRQKLMGHFLFFVMIAGAVSMLRASDEAFAYLHLMEENGALLATFVLGAWASSLTVILTKYMGYVKD